MIVVMNAASLGISEWNEDFNGVAYHEGEALVATPSGIYTLGEERTSGYIQTGQLGFGSTQPLVVPKCSLGIGGTPAAAVTVHVKERSVLTDYGPFDSTSAIDSEMTDRPIQLHRRLEGTGFAFTVEFTGELEAFDVYPVQVRRKRR